MMAVWAVYGVTNIKAMNATWTLMVGVTNATAAMLFSATGMVEWPEACTMLAGAVIGSYVCARWVRRFSTHHLRAGTTVFNVAMTCTSFCEATVNCRRPRRQYGRGSHECSKGNAYG